MLGAKAPRHVYAVAIHNQSDLAWRVTVAYSMPDNTTPETSFEIPPGKSETAERRLLTSGTMTQTGRVTKVALAGSNTLTEPFDGVFSPVKLLNLHITPQGVLKL